jgi:hypothetical protein
MPIKTVNAATLTASWRPRAIGGEIAARRDDLINIVFTVVLDSSSRSITPQGFILVADSNELSVHEAFSWLASPGRPIEYSPQRTFLDIARVTYKVTNPVRDRLPDVLATLIYDDDNRNVPDPILNLPAQLSTRYDVVPVSEPVPEPLTILGAATALGYGAILKLKSSKKTVS